MPASKIEYEIGNNIYGQPIKLIRVRPSGTATDVWEIHRGPANQRDDKAYVGGLTEDNIKSIMAAVNETRR